VGHYERFALRLRYLIGKDADPGTDDSITVIGYDATTPPKNGVKYCNLLDEKNTGKYGPHIHSETGDEYNEPAPDPERKGFWDNVREQIARAKAQGFVCIYWDNCDTYTASVVLLVYNETVSHGLTIWAKNPALVDGNREAILAHSAVVGVIVEKDCGSPSTYDAMRKAIGKPDLPIRFVSYGNGRNWAQQTAGTIQAGAYSNMGVTYSSEGEYGSVEDVLLPTGESMGWRLAKSLETLRSQVNAKWPNRDKSSDGTIGDAAHQATNSDHNQNSAGVVTAMDITHDPAHGLDARKLAETLVASRDPRIKYIISNAQIVSSQVSPWRWRPYTGANAHRQHVHISVAGDYDDPRPWNLGETPVAVPGRNTNITATRFSDSQVAYTGDEAPAPGWNNRMGVALPYRFKGKRPKVRVFKGGKSVDCEIIDIGPWYDGTAARGPFDPYWETGSRPRAESDPKTNGAGIDLTLPADAALGLNGKGLVDWEFVKDAVKEPVEEPQSIPAVEAALKDIVAALRPILEKHIKKEPEPVTQSNFDWGKLLQPLLAELAPKIVPLLMPYVAQMLPQLLPYLLDAMFGRRQSVMSKPAVQMGASGIGGGLLVAIADHFLTK
jgi:hypothetical protein